LVFDPIFVQLQTFLDMAAETLTVVASMETTGMEGPSPISIKEILAQLDGEFPMDEAVVEGGVLLLLT
jgi:hypothetical protein